MNKLMKFFFITFVFFQVYICATVISLSPGVSYENDKSQNLSIHKIYIDPKKSKMILAKSSGNKSQKTSEIASDQKSVAAINAGFFDFGQSSKFKNFLTVFKDLIGFNDYITYPVSTLKIKDNWYSLTENFNSILAWSNISQRFIIDSVLIKYFIKINNLEYSVRTLNKPNSNGITIYDNNFGKCTPVKDNVVELKVENNIIESIKFNGCSKITSNTYICSIPINKNYNKNKFKVGQKAFLKTTYSNKSYDWNNFDYIVSGFPILVKNGQVYKMVLESKNRFFTDKHPRTAVGILSDGKLLLIVIDGRQKLSEGISLLDLANYMIKSHCLNAINLDGGGSSTMVVNNKIINSPSGRKYSIYSGPSAERPISNAILIF